MGTAGNLFVVLEFCAHGNVRSYLLANRTRYVNQLVDDFVGQSSTQQFEYTKSPMKLLFVMYIQLILWYVR